MSGKTRVNTKNKLRFLDIVIVILFLLIAAFFVNLFWRDLMMTINLKNVTPVGTVVLKKNIVQRRHSNRVLWDRISYESPVYIGDLIRVADISAATLNIEENSLDLDENTLIRIIRSADGEGIQIILSQGKISLSAGSAGNIVIDMNGKQVQAAPGAVMSAAAGDNGSFLLQVIEGSARFIGEGAGREITSGMAVAMDAAGNEIMQRSAVVTSPPPNARYLKNSSDPYTVNFSWNKINIDPSQSLRLDISRDRNFSQIFRVIENLDNRAQVLLDSSVWFWRLSLEDAVLTAGNLTIADGDLQLESPAQNSLFCYQDELPVVNFHWAQAEDAVSYTIEISKTPDFAVANVRYSGPAAFYSESRLAQGIWYWRVMPVFPPVFKGDTSFSTPASFRIERGAFDDEMSLAQWLASLTAEERPSAAAPQSAAAPVVNLLTPANGASIAGLTALRAQTVFQWNTDESIASSRFVLSSNSNPLQGRAAVTIQNPGRTVRLDRLGAGTWYWTVELQTADGVTISASQPRRLVVQPIPLLPSPQNMSPAADTVFSHENLESLRDIVFSWSAVQGANAYIFTLYQQSSSERRQIVRSTESGTSYTLTNLSLLDRGSFVWQVEAVNTRNNAVEQRGRVGESAFILDFQPPLPVQIEDTGILYGN